MRRGEERGSLGRRCWKRTASDRDAERVEPGAQRGDEEVVTGEKLIRTNGTIVY